MKLNKIMLFVFAICFLFITSSIAIVVNPPVIVRDFTSAGTYYHSSGNLAYFAVDHVMTFTQVVVDSTYVEFNNTKFNISSPNRINISLSYLGTTMNGSSGTTIISFYAQTTAGNARFNISGLTSSRTYTIYKNNATMVNATANSTGWIYFTNSVWTTAYFNIKLLGVLPTVTTNASTGVEETNATLHGYLNNDGGDDCTVGFQYGTTTSYGNTWMDDNSYIYAVGDHATGKIYQYWKSNLTKKAESADYGGSIFGLTQDDTYIYIGGETTQKVYQYWKSNLTKKAETLSYGGNIRVVTDDSTYIYVGGQTTKKVYQYWKSNMTFKAMSADYGGSIYGIAEDSTYIYAAGGTTKKVYQYWKSNLTKKAESADYGGTVYVLIDDSTYVYMGGGTTNKVYQYWKSNLTKKAESADYGGIIWSLSEDSSYIYVGGATTVRVRQYWKSNMTYKSQTASYGGTIYALILDDTYVYAAGVTTNKVYQYWKSNLIKKAETLSYGETIYALSNQEEFTSGKTFNYTNLVGLTPGQLYHYRAVATNSNGTSYGSDMTLLTKPNEPTALTITDTASGQQTLTWTHGTGYNRSVVRGTIGSYPTTSHTGTAIYNNTGNSVVRTGLTYGNDWYYRVWEYTVYGSSFKFSDTYTQSHLKVANTSTVTTNATLGIEETNATLKGFLTNNGSATAICGFWYDTDSGLPYATNHSNGVVANHTAFIYNAPLSPGTRYYARAWASNAMGFVYGSETSFVTKPNAPDTASFTITSNTRSLDLSWTKGAGTNTTLILRKQGAYPLTKTDGTIVYNGTGSTYSNTGLTPGVGYGYRAWSYTVWGTTWQFSDLNASISEITKPEGPIHGNASMIAMNPNGTLKIRLNWTKGSGANTTIVVKNTNHYPTSWTDGTIIYNGTGTYTNVSLSIGATDYYKAWSYAAWIINPHWYEISANATNISLPGGGLLINCFDETTHVNLTFDVKISNPSGTSVFESVSNVNTLVVNASLCPQGDNIQVTISATGYQSRPYLLDIYPGIIYLLNSYLPNVSAPADEGEATPETNLSYIFVITVVGEQYEYGTSPPIEGVRVSVKRYINTTGTFVDVGSMLTDANGQCSIYLRLNVGYKIFCNKSGFYDSITDFTTDLNIRTKTCRIHVIVPGIPTYKIFNDIITFNAVMYNGSFILINYDDTNHTTINTHIYVYEIYNNTRTLVFTFIRVGDQTFQENATPINKSRTYLVELFYNNSNVFDMTSPVYLTVLPIELFTPGFTKPDFNDRINKVFGPPSILASWWTVITVAFALILLGSLGPFNTPFAIILSGASVLGMEGIGAILFINTVNVALIAIGPVAIFIGMIYWMTKGDGETTL
jgi:hypothetical protein